MAEVLVLAALGGAGLLLLAPVEGRLPRLALGALAFPVGATAYAIVAATCVAVTGAVLPLPTLIATVTIGLMSAAVGVAKRRVSSEFFVTLVGTIALLGVVAAALRGVHLTRLTIDSMRYLLAAVDLQLPAGITEMHPTDLLKRQLALPAWHTLASLTDRRYLAGLGPLFGLSGAVFLGWMVWQRAAGAAVRHRRLVVVAAVGFVVASNRALYDWFYVNTHGAMAVLMLVAVAGFWLSLVEGEDAWAVPAGLALAGTLLLRAEAPLVVALVLIAFAPALRTWRVRLFAAVPAVFVTLVWYGGTLWHHAPGGNVIALDAPVLMGLVASVGAGLVTIAGGFAATRIVVVGCRMLLLPSMAVALLGWVIADPSIFVSTVAATARNVAIDGLWGFTWVVLVPVLAVALVVQRIPWGRAWATVVSGYGLLFFVLPYLRGSPWRVGPGDSGNRILGHVFLVATAFAVLTALERFDDRGDGVSA